MACPAASSCGRRRLAFVGGSDEVFDLKANGVGLGEVNKAVPQGILDELETVKADIIAGKITIPDTVK